LIVTFISIEHSAASDPSLCLEFRRVLFGSFPITAMDDALLDGTQAVTITVSATGYANGTQTLNVTDVETLSVTTDLGSISENGRSEERRVGKESRDRGSP